MRWGLTGLLRLAFRTMVRTNPAAPPRPIGVPSRFTMTGPVARPSAAASSAICTVATIGIVGLVYELATGRIQSSSTSGLSRVLGLGEGSGTAHAADEERSQLYELTRQRIEAHPIGGSGFNGALTGHDLYSQMYETAGLMGLAAILILLFWVTASGLLRARRERNRLASALWAGYAGYLVAGLRSNQMWDRYIWMFLVLAACAALTRPPEPGAEDEVKAAKRKRREDEFLPAGYVIR
jgi:hypothetical protein